MTKGLLVCCLSLCIVAEAIRDQEQQRHASAFHSFMQQQGRLYERNSAEYLERFTLFSQSLVEVEAHNRKPNRLWTAGINHLSDRNKSELAALRGWRGGAPRNVNDAPTISKSSFLENSVSYPKSFSWSKLQSLSEVRNQRACGSCWAVATSTVLNAHSEIHQGRKKRTFSEQELVSCVQNPHYCGGEGGCRGATVELALKFVANHGLATEEEKPYEGVDAACTRLESNLPGQSMLSIQGVHDEDENMDDMSQPGIHQVHPSKPGAQVGLKAWERLPANDYNALMGALIERGPVAVSAAADGWNSYMSGIFTSGSKTVDHAVTLVGYGQDMSERKYWLIQNSWTDSWGENGKLRLHRQDTDSKNCGVDTKPELGTGCKGGPKKVVVCGDCGVLYDSVVPHFYHAAEQQQ
mmetsp:Transcript_134997/g.262889  ORF Transcript_134997/g.262889 Transcript_134997/m.262889 type:complete len:409 (+) Transcript_134997:93-1319(+)